MWSKWTKLVLINLLVIEGVFQIYWRLAPASLRYNPFPDKEFGTVFLNEYSDGFQNFTPFLTWTGKPLQGQYINVDGHGRRVNWNPSTQNADTKIIWMFGGSTTWGYGARDEKTIPSELSRKLANTGHRFHVVNFGERGYTLAQNINRLVLELRAGRRPDYALFYEGVDDIFVAYENAESLKIHQENVLQKRLLASRTPISTFIDRSYTALWIHSGVLRAVREWTGLESGVRNDGYVYRHKGEHLSAQQLAILSRDTINNFSHSWKLVQALGTQYQFKTHLYLQPSLLTEKQVLAEEKNHPFGKESRLGKFYSETFRAIANKNLPASTDISQVFSGLEESRPQYLDWCHPVEEANALIANAIYNDLFPGPNLAE